MANSSLSRTQGGISGSAGKNVAPTYKAQSNIGNSIKKLFRTKPITPSGKFAKKMMGE